MRSIRTSTILFVSGGTGHALSRVERTWLPLMTELVAKGATVLLVAPPRSAVAQAARDVGVTVAPYRVVRLNVLITRNRLNAYLERYAPQVAISTGYHADVALRMAARNMPVKVVNVLRCGEWPITGAGPLTTMGRQRLEGRTRERVDLFVVDSYPLRNRMVADGVDPARIEVIRQGVDTAALGARCAEPVDLPEGRPLVGYAGSLDWSRGLLALPALASELRERYPHARVVVAGDGPARIPLLPAALEGKITLLGRVDSLPSVMKELDVCVFPTSEKGIPTSLLEAAALGRPIVAGDVPHVQEAFDHGVDILFVPPGDVKAIARAVLSLLDDPGRAAVLGDSARMRIIDEHPASGARKRWMQVIQRLI